MTSEALRELVVRLTPDGPNGLRDVGYADPSAVAAGDPREAAHVFHQREDGKCIVGVWEAQPGTLDYVDYPFDELCVVLSGALELTPQGGSTETYGPGDTFLIRKGFTGRWHMPVALRKYFMECHG